MSPFDDDSDPCDDSDRAVSFPFGSNANAVLVFITSSSTKTNRFWSVTSAKIAAIYTSGSTMAPRAAITNGEILGRTRTRIQRWWT